ncbi:Reticuline oxidase, partial [Cucurbita argyrosperma subsp. sororia]
MFPTFKQPSFVPNPMAFKFELEVAAMDIEGLSYVASLPFIIVDLINLNSISIDVESKTAWVQSDSYSLVSFIIELIASEKVEILGLSGWVICPTVGMWWTLKWWWVWAVALKEICVLRLIM